MLWTTSPLGQLSRLLDTVATLIAAAKGAQPRYRIIRPFPE